MINIVIPSYKRWDNLKGKDYFKSAKYVVPESQKDEYAKVLGEDRLIIIPDEEDGNITKKRNWILKNIPRPLVMIDDDVSCLKIRERRAENYISSKLDPELVESVIAEGFDLCREFGTVYWGVDVNYDDRHYLDFQPISLSNIVLGPFQGHLDHEFLFDDRMGTKEDYDMSLQVLNKYRKIVRLNKLSYDCEHGDNKGGIVSYRTKDREMSYCRAIEKKWGRSIISYPLRPEKMTDLLNGDVNIPIRGV